ncbi:hypothetical protein M8818_007642 [Zalaria obscura]|uniref:Uncharacterized protein n=1 Tax=Zalaria obscura TaxID=2024903 RepID=A0ACC3S2P1_9PEZI
MAAGRATVDMLFICLHKEPKKFPDVSPTESQIRRHLWWTLVAVDAQVAFASGLPPIIESRLYDVESVGESANEALYEMIISQGNGTKSVLGIFIGGKYNFYKRASELLHLLHSTFLSESEIDNVLRIANTIDAEMNARKESISAVEEILLHQAQIPRNDDGAFRHAESNPVLAKFTKILLSLFAAKPYPIMFGPVRRHGLLPYLRQKQPEERDRIWEKHGLDPSILTCPEKAEDISFVDREGQISDDGFPQGDMFGEQLWGPLPDTNEAWTSLGYATDPYLEFDMSQDLFRVT